jgi:hypothetical protein
VTTFASAAERQQATNRHCKAALDTQWRAQHAFTCSIGDTATAVTWVRVAFHTSMKKATGLANRPEECDDSEFGRHSGRYVSMVNG